MVPIQLNENAVLRDTFRFGLCPHLAHMKSINFLQANTVVAKDQPEYNNLYAYVSPKTEGPEGYVVFCWELSWRERIILFVTGHLWHTVLTFHTPLQPQRLTLDTPFENVE